MKHRLISHLRASLPLSLFWLALLPLYGRWLWRDQVVAPWDMSTHAKCALKAWECLSHGRPWRLYALSDYYPPLYHLLAAPFSLISTHPDIYCAANWLVLFALMLTTCWLGRLVSAPSPTTDNDHESDRDSSNVAGLAAGLLVPAFVSISWMARQPMTDLTLTLTVAVTLGLLARGRALTGRRQAHALGLAIAAGLLAKWPYLFFIALPLADYLWREWKFSRGLALPVPVTPVIEPKQKPNPNPSTATATSAGKPYRFHHTLAWLAFWPALLAGPWYIRALPRLIATAGPQLNGVVARREGDPGVLTLPSLTYYARQLYELYLRLPLTLLLAAGMAALIWRLLKNKPVPRAWRPLALSAASGYLILTLIANKDPRYIMPVVPVLTVVMTHWLGWLNGRRTRSLLWARRAALCGLALLSAALVYWNLFVFYRPDPRPAGVEEAAAWLDAHRPAGRGKIKVCVLPNDWRLNAAALDYALYRRDGRSGAKFIAGPLTADIFKDYQFLLLLDPPDPDTGLAPNQTANTRAAQTLPNWPPCATFPHGDGKTIHLLRRK